MKMETSAKLYSLNYSNVKTYLFALLFVAGNIALPQLCHLVPSPDYTDKINLACRCFRPCCAYRENRFFVSRPWSNSLLSTHRNRF